ncbi:MAG: DUF2934 domain-containing protein [Candidatus Firestonebacteria bacterium]
MAANNVRFTPAKVKAKAPVVSSNVNKEQLLKEIEKKAYELYLQRNGQHGNDLNDWLEAEKIIKKIYKL